MRIERRALTGDPATLATEIRALAPPPPDLAAGVAEILARVRAEGDAAVLELTRRFDDPDAVAVRASLDGPAVEPALEGALRTARDNVAVVARAQVDEDVTLVEFAGHAVVVHEAPVEAAAVYVPGGRAPYPSTVVMGAVTARVAGVERVVVCTPPPVDPAVLAAARLCEADEVYAMGGAQAIGALAFGTESVAPVDVIVGPGNAWVTEAKRQVFGTVGIDGLAGPSELVVVIEDADAVPLAALDLAAQAEHGEGSLVVATSSTKGVLDALERELSCPKVAGRPQDRTVPCVLVEAAEPLALADAVAPEHLQLMGTDNTANRVAGAVFVGTNAGTAFGDYVAGSNHVLPTGGAARFSSGLGPATFRRRFSEVRIGEAADLARAGAEIARAEGFELHARSMEARIDHNGRR